MHTLNSGKIDIFFCHLRCDVGKTVSVPLTRHIIIEIPFGVLFDCKGRRRHIVMLFESISCNVRCSILNDIFDDDEEKKQILIHINGRDDPVHAHAK